MLSKELSYHLIDDLEKLELFKTKIANSTILAIDTESNQFHAYRPQICLLQIATKDEIFIVDPLAFSKEDLEFFGKILSYVGVVKVLHGADNDILWFQRDFGWRVKNLFDTAIAARHLGLAKRGLSYLLSRYFSIESKSKKFAKYDWKKRPLQADALQYAALDVAYLIQLYEILEKELKQQNLFREVKEHSEQLAEKKYIPKEFDPSGYKKLVSTDTLTPKGKRLLRELYRWRHQICLRENRAPLFIMPNRALVELARSLPQNKARLSEIPTLPKRTIRKYGRDIINIIKSL